MGQFWTLLHFHLVTRRCLGAFLQISHRKNSSYSRTHIWTCLLFSWTHNQWKLELVHHVEEHEFGRHNFQSIGSEHDYQSVSTLWFWVINEGKIYSYIYEDSLTLKIPCQFWFRSVMAIYSWCVHHHEHMANVLHKVLSCVRSEAQNIPLYVTQRP